MKILFNPMKLHGADKLAGPPKVPVARNDGFYTQPSWKGAHFAGMEPWPLT